MSKFNFLFNPTTGSFEIADPSNDRVIVLPHDDKFMEAAGPVWPNKFFQQLDDGTQAVVTGERFRGKSALFLNKADGWFVRMNTDQKVVRLKQPQEEDFDGHHKISETTRVELQHATIELFDFRRDLQAKFKATVISDNNLIGQYAQVEQPMVEAKPLQGAWFPVGGGAMSFLQGPAIQAGLARLEEDFATNIAQCTKIRTKGVLMAGEGHLYKGDPSKGEPLITIHQMSFANTSDYYAVPDKVAEVYARDPDSEPLAQEGHTTLYKVRGGHVIEDTAKNESYFFFDHLPWMVHTTLGIADRLPSEIKGDLHVINLENGMYKRTDGHMTCHTGERSSVVYQTKALWEDLRAPYAAEQLVRRAARGALPVGKEPLERDRKPTENTWIIHPIKPTEDSLRWLLSPDRREPTIF